MRYIVLTIFYAALLSVSLPSNAGAIPIFARLYNTSCVSCHDVFPHLNAYGTAFKNRGYRLEKNIQKRHKKDNQLKMGAPAYKKMWPEAIWPTDIPMMFPVAAHFSARYASKEAPNGNSTFAIPAKTDILFAANFDDRFSLFAELEMNDFQDIDFGYRFQYRFAPSLNITLGSVGPEYWLRNHYRLTESPYYWAEWRNSSGSWSYKDGANGGIELWGNMEGPGGQGGLTYAMGLGNGQSNSHNIDLNDRKDYYFYASYKYGGIGVLGSIAQDIKADRRDYDKYLLIDGFYYNGLATVTKKNDAFILYGGSAAIQWQAFRVAVGIVEMRSRFYRQNLHRRGSFVGARYTIYPWLWGLARYEYQTEWDTDHNKTNRRIIPALVALVRANIRVSAEYLALLEGRADGGLRFNLNFAF